MDPISLHFPFAGVDVSQAVGKQPNRPAAEGKYARSTVKGVNVRAYDRDARARGGSRPGLEKYLEARPGDIEYATQHLAMLVTTGDDAVQPSQSGRKVLLVAVAKGNVYTCPAGGSTWTLATNNTGESPPLIATGLLQSAQCNQDLFFADGTNWCFYQSSTGTVESWVLDAGTLPADDDGNTPRLICLWHGRLVLSGIIGLPNQLFATKISDPFDMNFSPDVPIPADSAWSSSTGPQGLMGDVVNALIPFTDDVLIIGMDSSMALFQGDPLGGGSILGVTTTIGMAWGKAWCQDPSGVVYFFSNRTGVFRFVPGATPERMSFAVDSLLLDVDTGENGIVMVWNDRYKSMHVFITLLTTQADTIHYTWESQANAWWQDNFLDNDMNPLCAIVFDGNEENDRVTLIGGWDGYVRSISSTATDDDGQDIQSEVFIGPFLTQFGDDVMLKEMQAVLGENSGDVDYFIYVADTAEEALTATSVANGTFGDGRNFTDLIMMAGHAAYIRLVSINAWAMESIRAILGTQGLVRQRGKN